jgi:hypothetical protein
VQTDEIEKIYEILKNIKFPQLWWNLCQNLKIGHSFY